MIVVNHANAAQLFCLVKKGIQASRITTDAKGDTIQPFGNNDDNRVTVVIGKE